MGKSPNHFLPNLIFVNIMKKMDFGDLVPSFSGYCSGQLNLNCPELGKRSVVFKSHGDEPTVKPRLRAARLRYQPDGPLSCLCAALWWYWSHWHPWHTCKDSTLSLGCLTDLGLECSLLPVQHCYEKLETRKTGP